MLHTKAPDFTLQATTGQPIKLSDLLGSYVVLIFYPANDTPICNGQLAEMSVNIDDLIENNTRVFGVNTASVEKHRGYCARKKLEFPILSDPGGATAKKYNAYMGWFPMNRRTVVVIDPHGNICFFMHGRPTFERVITVIKETTNKVSKAT